VAGVVLVALATALLPAVNANEVRGQPTLPVDAGLARSR
jgi:hypothetical protein